MSTTQTDFLRYLRTLAARQATAMLSDQQLLQRFLHERSEASFAALVARHGPMVLSVCRRILQHAQDAEDAFQATFLVLARKANSIRKQTSLGSWLHGVAYHSAECLRAKTRRRVAHERRLSAPPPGEAMDDVTWRELRAALDEELRSLPEKYRAPLVLCYLEGRTQDEAARHLGWSKNTFRRRLESARNALGRRLTRRGITLSAALTAPLLIDCAAQASLPPLLAAATVRAGLSSALGNKVSGIVSAQVVTLAEGATGTLLAKKASVVLILLVSLTLGIGGLLAHRAVHSRSFAEAPVAPKAAPAPLPQSPPARSASKGEAIEIKGRVLGPDGKPLAGAKVYVTTHTYKDKRDPKVRTETDVDGRFHFTASHEEVDRNESIVAVAPDYGPDWIALKEIRKDQEVIMRLVKDDVPINGRLLDLEGRPIAGAAVHLRHIRKMPGEDLTPWLTAMQAKSGNRNALDEARWRYQGMMKLIWDIPGSTKSVKTGKDGRFQLRGFGRERVVNLHIEGPGIESQDVTVLMRPGSVKALPADMRGAAFELPVAPNKPIRGTVRDKATGEPLTGVRIYCWPNGTETMTDKAGHYEIPGVRKAEQYSLNAGYKAAPYLVQWKHAGDTPGLDPITVNFELERGLQVRVRVREIGTGKPVSGSIRYAVRADNPNLKNFSIAQNVVSADVISWDGTYDLTAIPGPGYIAIRADEDRYTRARVKGQKEDALYMGGVASLHIQLFHWHTVVPINPSPDDPKSLVCDVDLDPGMSVSGIVVDPQDRPLSGANATGLGSLLPNWLGPELTESRFRVGGFLARRDEIRSRRRRPRRRESAVEGPPATPWNANRPADR
jgi:RNA polymerase sigma factor (sigma-70 family)